MFVSPNDLKTRVEAAIAETTTLIGKYAAEHKRKKSIVWWYKYAVAVFTALSSAAAIESVRVSLYKVALSDALSFFWPAAKTQLGAFYTLAGYLTLGVVIAVVAVLVAALPLLGDLTSEVDALGSRVGQYTEFRWYFQRVLESACKPDADPSDYRDALNDYYTHYTAERDANGDNQLKP